MLLKRLTFSVLLIGKSVLLITNVLYPRCIGKGIVVSDVGYLRQDILKFIKLRIDQRKMKKHEEERDYYHD